MFNLILYFVVVFLFEDLSHIDKVNIIWKYNISYLSCKL